MLILAQRRILDKINSSGRNPQMNGGQSRGNLLIKIKEMKQKLETAASIQYNFSISDE